MDIVIKDTNIIIDLINTGLDRYSRQLGVEYHTTLYVLREVKDPEQRKRMADMINSGELIVENLSGIDHEKFLDMIEIYDGVNNLTEADCSVIILAEKYSCRLLTSDQKLKRQAENRGLRVNGLLWIVDKIVEKGILTGQEMIPYLECYLNINDRSPQTEINKRIINYKK